MYSIVTAETVKIEEISKDLNLPVDHVKTYFSNYDVYKKFPIRDLTFQEQELISAIRKIKTMEESELIKLLEEHNITIKDLEKDQLLMERRLARYNDDYSYSLTRKYQHFILEPAILHGNVEAPLTRPLDMENIVTMLSNIAMGLTTQGYPIDPKVQISALSKIADIYTTSKVLTMNSKGLVNAGDLRELSPKELTRLIKHIQTNKDLDEVDPVEETKSIKPKKTPIITKETLNGIKELIIFV